MEQQRSTTTNSDEPLTNDTGAEDIEDDAELDDDDTDDETEEGGDDAGDTEKS